MARYRSQLAAQQITEDGDVGNDDNNNDDDETNTEEDADNATDETGDDDDAETAQTETKEPTKVAISPGKENATTTMPSTKSKMPRVKSMKAGSSLARTQSRKSKTALKPFN